MEEYLIYFHFRLMHQGIVPQREISAIRERLARTRKCQELFRMVILPNLSYFGPIFLVRNENCVATLFIANLPIPENR